MNTNDNAERDAAPGELGVASTDTLGGPGFGEEMGFRTLPGIGND